jgi:hypothetical protein
VAAVRRAAAAAYSPSIDPAGFTTAVDNPYFPLPPGARWVYEGRVVDGLERTVVEVTGHTRVVMGVTCVVVRDTVTLDGCRRRGLVLRGGDLRVRGR